MRLPVVGVGIAGRPHASAPSSPWPARSSLAMVRTAPLIHLRGRVRPGPRGEVAVKDNRGWGVRQRAPLPWDARHGAAADSCRQGPACVVLVAGTCLRRTHGAHAAIAVARGEDRGAWGGGREEQGAAPESYKCGGEEQQGPAPKSSKGGCEECLAGGEEFGEFHVKGSVFSQTCTKGNMVTGFGYISNIYHQIHLKGLFLGGKGQTIKVQST